MILIFFVNYMPLLKKLIIIAGFFEAEKRG